MLYSKKFSSANYAYHVVPYRTVLPLADDCNSKRVSVLGLCSDIKLLHVLGVIFIFVAIWYFKHCNTLFLCTPLTPHSMKVLLAFPDPRSNVMWNSGIVTRWSQVDLMKCSNPSLRHPKNDPKQRWLAKDAQHVYVQRRICEKHLIPSPGTRSSWGWTSLWQK